MIFTQLLTVKFQRRHPPPPPNPLMQIMTRSAVRTIILDSHFLNSIHPKENVHKTIASWIEQQHLSCRFHISVSSPREPETGLMQHTSTTLSSLLRQIPSIETLFWAVRMTYVGCKPEKSWTRPLTAAGVKFSHIFNQLRNRWILITGWKQPWMYLKLSIVIAVVLLLEMCRSMWRSVSHSNLGSTSHPHLNLQVLLSFIGLFAGAGRHSFNFEPHALKATPLGCRRRFLTNFSNVILFRLWFSILQNLQLNPARVVAMLMANASVVPLLQQNH